MYFMNPGPRQELEDGLADAGIPVKAVMDSGHLIVDEGADNPEAMRDALGSALAEIHDRLHRNPSVGATLRVFLLGLTPARTYWQIGGETASMYRSRSSLLLWARQEATMPGILSQGWLGGGRQVRLFHEPWARKAGMAGGADSHGGGRGPRARLRP